jgi:hypothetical protein
MYPEIDFTFILQSDTIRLGNHLLYIGTMFVLMTFISHREQTAKKGVEPNIIPSENSILPSQQEVRENYVI